MAVALTLTSALPALIANVGTADPLVSAPGMVTLLLVALLACYVRARSATRVEPVEALPAD